MHRVLTELDRLVLSGVGRQHGKHDFLVLIAGQRAHDHHVILTFRVGLVEQAFGLFLQFFRNPVFGGNLEAIGQHQHRTHVQGAGFTRAGHLLHAGVVGDFHHGFKHGVGQYRLGHFHDRFFLGQVTVGANDPARGFPGGCRSHLLGPERIGHGSLGSYEVATDQQGDRGDRGDRTASQNLESSLHELSKKYGQPRY